MKYRRVRKHLSLASSLLRKRTGRMCFDSRQMAFEFVIARDEEHTPAVESHVADDGQEDSFDTAPLIQRTVSASTVKREKTHAPTSVFDLARRPIAVKLAGHDGGAAIYRTTTADGITRCVRVREQDTEEWQEKEQARRARQRPPRPTKQRFKMRNSRVWADEPK